MAMFLGIINHSAIAGTSHLDVPCFAPYRTAPLSPHLSPSTARGAERKLPRPEEAVRFIRTLTFLCNFCYECYVSRKHNMFSMRHPRKDEENDNSEQEDGCIGRKCYGIS